MAQYGPAPSNRTFLITVEYDCRGYRKKKKFRCPFKARAFFVTKDRLGKRPVNIYESKS